MTEGACCREKIGQAIIELCAGATCEEALLAQTDALATSIGAIGQMNKLSRPEVWALVAEITENLLFHIDDNWGTIQFEDDHG